MFSRLKSLFLIVSLLMLTSVCLAQYDDNPDFPSYEYNESSSDYYNPGATEDYYYDEDTSYSEQGYYNEEESYYDHDFSEDSSEQQAAEPQEPVKPEIQPAPPINLSEKSIRIGRIPYMSIKSMMAQSVPLLRHLQKTIQAKEVRLVSTGKNYSTIIEALVRGTVDFAWVGPTAYLKSNEKDQLKPIAKARFGSDTAYCGVFIAPAKGSVQGLEDLVDKKIGFVDPESASGYIYPRYLLKRLGIKFTKKAKGKFLKSHDNVLKAVLAGKVDAGVCLEATLNAARAKDPELDKKIIILAKTPEIPSDVIICRKDCPINLQESMQKALISVKQQEMPAGSPTFLPAFDEEFASVEAIMQAVGALEK
jgi:phosphonate transport system substrate-binding protein